MKFTTTYILLGAAFVLLAVLAGSLLFSDSASKEGLLLQKFASAALKHTDVDTLEIEITRPTAEKLVFVRGEAGVWRLATPFDARINSTLVDEIVKEWLTVRKETRNTDLTRNLAVHGLDNPSVKVTLKRGSDKSVTVALGNISAGERPFLYVTTSDDPKTPLAVRKGALRNLFISDDAKKALKGETSALVRKLGDFRLFDLIGLGVVTPAEQLKSIQITTGGEELKLVRTQSSWEYVQPPGLGEADIEGSGPAGGQAITGIRRLGTVITSMRVPSAADFIDEPSDPAKYGLNPDNKERIRIEITREATNDPKQPTREVLLIGSAIPNSSPEKCYAQVEGTKPVVAVLASEVKLIRDLMADKKILRNKDLVRLQEESVDAIDLQFGTKGEKIELRKVGQPAEWKVIDSTGQLTKANTNAITSLIRQLNPPVDAGGGRRIKDFPVKEGQYEAAFANENRVEMKIWERGILPEEKKADNTTSTKPTIRLRTEPTVTLVFGPSELAGTPVRRTIGKVVTEALVAEKFLDTVGKRRLDYIDPTLNTFVASSVVKLQIDRYTDAARTNRQTIELERTTKEGKNEWTLLQPARRKGRVADNDRVTLMLNLLNSLTPTKLVAERADEAALKQLELQPGKAWVEVTLTMPAGAAGGDKRVYRFGQTSDDGTSVRALQEGKDFIFEVPKPFLEQLQKEDFLNLTVYRINEAQIRGLKLTGWLVTAGDGVTKVREFERKGGAWDFKGKGTYPLNPTAVQNFVSQLLEPQAVRFVTEDDLKQDGVSPQLEFEQDALEVEIQLAEGEPRQLRVGGLDKSKENYIVRVNSVPGELVLLPKRLFEEVRSSASPFLKK